VACAKIMLPSCNAVTTQYTDLGFIWHTEMYACSALNLVLMNPVMTVPIKQIPVSIKHEADNISGHLKINSDFGCDSDIASSHQRDVKAELWATLDFFFSVGSPRETSVIAVGKKECRRAGDNLLGSKSRCPVS